MTTTANQPSVVDIGEFVVKRTISVAAPIEKVWAAVTEPKHIAQWFGQGAELDEVAVGGRGLFSFEGYGDVPVRIEELDPPRMIAYRWSNELNNVDDPSQLDPEHSTVFRFTLEAVDGGTQLTVVEAGFGALADPTGSMESHRGGWDSELDELAAYLEGGS
ncbi:SRPBCC family protein [Arthrobacter sp. ISL-48]|uniref:SRPBCC family protein n=1 Tax=Arthrobacter sp. ISL-48 TaxID=2819110 RepID=UPI001BEB4DB5|nr:SRPBCC family protein [Arthrobacter sp. ISL-48]MBT2533806.1 SRPBCC family protein [Arthrobacter sp. ISL-48]